MSIPIQEFKKIPIHNYETLILEFLKANKTKAFKKEEIARILKVNEHHVSTVLSFMRKKNLLENRTPYWALKEGTTK